MSELNDETVEDVTDIEETETGETTSDEITYDQAIEWKKKAERLEKAEKTLVEQKRKLKELEKSDTPSKAKYLTEQDLEVRDFIKSNPTLNEYRSELETYLKKDIPLEEAKLLIENKDRTIKNRQTISQSRISDGESPSATTFTRDQLASMSRADYNRAMDLIDSGKAIKVK